MLILAMDTSCRRASVSLFEGQQHLETRGIGGTGQSASAFPPTIQEILESHQRSMSDVHVLALALGPGSFTGLRVGVVAAKTLAYATGCRLVGVNSLAGIAAHAMLDSDRSRICAVMDAQRGQLFAARFELDGPWRPRMLGQLEIIERAQIQVFAAGDPVTGPGLEKLESELAGVEVVDRQYWASSSEYVGRLAWPRIGEQSFDDLWALKPMYYRASAAEEKKLRSS